MTDTPKPLTADEIAAVKRVAETRGDILGQRLITTIEQQREQIEKLRLSLQVIGDMPIPEQDGMLAANMRIVAREALAATEPPK